MMQLLHKRDDGTFVAEVNGMPYHVVPDDALWVEAQAAEAARFTPLAPEPDATADQDSVAAQMANIRARMLDALVGAVLTGDKTTLQALAEHADLLRPHMPK